uniref:F-box domain-containing protein n=1 Tax=Peronospora matthiolae TaxID=2874970 RepID=A0AAV1TXP4_9STRA
MKPLSSTEPFRLSQTFSQTDSQPVVSPRLPLEPHMSSTVEDARLRNLNKRVKLQSKRLRHLWPRIVAFLGPLDVVVVGSTCRQLHRLLDSDRVWQARYDRVVQDQVTRLLVPHLETRFDADLPVKEKLRRVIRARRVHDPANVLQRRLREAERKAFRAKLQQRTMRNVVWMNVPLVLAVCCLSVWSYTTATSKSDYLSKTTATQLRGAGHGSSARVYPVKKFVLVTDLLLLIAVMVLSVGDLVGKALYTVGMLLAMETVIMLVEIVAWSSPVQVAHAFLVLLALIFNAVLAAKEKKDYARKLAAFLPSYESKR